MKNKRCAMNKKTDTTKPYLKNDAKNLSASECLIIPCADRAELLSGLLNFMDNPAPKKIQLLRYLLNNLNRENMVIITVDEIFTATGLSKPFILGVLKNLEQLQVITRRSGVIKFSPVFLNTQLQVVIELEGGNG